MERANAAMQKLLTLIPIAELLRISMPNSIGPFQRGIEVTADPPEYKDHYILMVLPLAIDVSQIPLEIDGVPIRVRHADLPPYIPS